MIDLEQKAVEAALDREANMNKKRQERITKRFSKLKDSDRRHFQSDFVMAQAKEISNYIRDMQMSPLKAWYDSLKEMAMEANFMEKYFLTLDDFDNIVPDEIKIKGLILPESMTEEESRAGTLDFE